MLELKETDNDAARKAKGMADQAQAATQAIGDKAKEAPSSVMGSVKETMHDVAAAASDFVGKATDKAQEWASSVGDAAVHAKDKTQQMASATVERVGDLGNGATDLIRRYPLPALLVGLGAGFLLAQVLHRSSSKRT